MKIRKFSLHSDESLLINIVDISSSRKSRGLETNDIVEDGNVWSGNDKDEEYGSTLSLMLML